MSVLIKNVDKELYRRFKAKAVMRGLKVGTALSLAIEKWLNEDELDDITLKSILNKEILKSIKIKLLEEHDGEWALISDGEYIGVYETDEELLKTVKKLKLTHKVNLISHLTKQDQRVVRLGIRRRTR